MSKNPLHDLAPRYDVVIAGARCAGAATALLLAREGMRVLVVDPLPRGRDTLSTHALMRGAVVQLHRWGLLDRLREAGTPAIRATAFDYGDEVVRVPIKARDGVDALHAPRRTVLDPILSDAAEEAGATVARGVAVVDLLRDGGGGTHGVVLAEGTGEVPPVRAGTVVGADGLHSRVARLAGASVVHRARHATASIYGYWGDLPCAETRWYFRPGLGMGLIPTDAGATCVFVSMSPAAFEAGRHGGLEALFHRIVDEIDPPLGAALRATTREGSLRAFAGHPGQLRAPIGRGWALVGDAGYFRDPLTAHGITDALRDAELLARALVEGTDASMAAYGALRDQAAMGVLRVTDAIASLTWSLAEVKALHHELSREMNRAMETLSALPVV